MASGRKQPNRHPTGPLGLPHGLHNGAGAVEVQPDGPKPPAANKPVPKLFTPVKGHVAGWADPAPETTHGGVVIPTGSAAQFASPTMNVIAVGPGCTQVKVGDKVLVHSATQVRKAFVGEHTFVVCAEDQILGVMDAPPADPTSSEVDALPTTV